jgi:hypothetical protein
MSGQWLLKTPRPDDEPLQAYTLTALKVAEVAARAGLQPEN